MISCIVAAIGSAGCNAPPITEKLIFEPGAEKLPETGIDPELILLAKSDHIALLEKAMEAYKSMSVKNYTCTFTKQEVMGGITGKKQETKIKFRQDPFSVVITWIKNPPQGDRLIYVKGKYKDKQGRSRMIVRPKGGLAQLLVGRSVLKLPDGPDAMRNTLRPVTMFGFENSLRSLLDVYRQARGRGELKQEYEGVYDLAGRKCLILTRLLLKQREEYQNKTTFIAIDIETLMPLQLIGYDWDNRLLCNYEYRDVKFNLPLTEKDFTPQSNDIHPPKE